MVTKIAQKDASVTKFENTKTYLLEEVNCPFKLDSGGVKVVQLACVMLGEGSVMLVLV